VKFIRSHVSFIVNSNSENCIKIRWLFTKLQTKISWLRFYGSRCRWRYRARIYRRSWSVVHVNRRITPSRHHHEWGECSGHNWPRTSDQWSSSSWVGWSRHPDERAVCLSCSDRWQWPRSVDWSSTSSSDQSRHSIPQDTSQQLSARCRPCTRHVNTADHYPTCTCYYCFFVTLLCFIAHVWEWINKLNKYHLRCSDG